jgi:hypothetical protein
MGRPFIETRPAMITIIDRTVERIGRLMKIEEIN